MSCLSLFHELSPLPPLQPPHLLLWLSRSPLAPAPTRCWRKAVDGGGGERKSNKSRGGGCNGDNGDNGYTYTPLFGDKREGIYPIYTPTYTYELFITFS